MKKSEKGILKKDSFVDEDGEWLKLTPAQRMLETTKLWKLYVALGGSLDPEPDPQSPFYKLENEEAKKKELETLCYRLISRKKKS